MSELEKLDIELDEAKAAYRDALARVYELKRQIRNIHVDNAKYKIGEEVEAHLWPSGRGHVGRQAAWVPAIIRSYEPSWQTYGVSRRLKNGEWGKRVEKYVQESNIRRLDG